MTMNFPVEIHSPFAQIADRFCPNVSKELIHSHISEHSSKFRLVQVNIYLISLFIAFLCTLVLMFISQIVSYLRTMRMINPTRRRKIHL